MDQRPEPARAALPYGAVMATGGASQLAGSSGLHPLALPLLWLAIVEAGAIPLLGALAGRPMAASVRTVVRSPSTEHLFGDFTVPVGLAVIGAGLAGLRTGSAVYGASAAVALAWASTVALLVRLALPGETRPFRVEAVSGVWFLGPAALLADAVGVAAVSHRLHAPVRAGLGWLALMGCGAGVAGYGLVVLLAAWRVQRVGTGGAARAPWWISAGCGGLAAASIGQVSRVAPVGGGVHGFSPAALGAWAAGSALLVPVVTGSIISLCQLRRIEGRPPWPPTFSMAVYALGADQAGRLWPLHPVSVVGGAAGLATVALWLATAGLHAGFLLWRLRGRSP